MAKKIKVIIKAPGAKPYGTAISPKPESLRRRFGREFRVFRFAEDGCIICAKNESGLDYNCECLGRDFYGLMIFCGYSEKGFRDYPEEFRVFKALHPSLFRDFEKEKSVKHKDIGKMIGFITLIGAWAFIGLEFARQIIELI